MVLSRPSLVQISSLLLLGHNVAASPLVERDDTTATVNLDSDLGTPQHLASGIIYGIPDNYPNQIPAEYYTGMAFSGARSGGAQLEAPSRGWIWGEFEGRFESTYLNYLVARDYGALFQVLPHDLWGTDNANSSTVWPGDNGDWSDYLDFLDTLIEAFKSHNMLDGLAYDAWNEPDLGGGYGLFWDRDMDQWLELWDVTYTRIRSDPDLNSVLFLGPSLSGAPSESNSSFWPSFLDTIKSNGSIPDQYSWHLEATISDPNDDIAINNGTLAAMLETRGLPWKQLNINEYGTFAEQVPSGNAWWIARLERYEAIGLRGNWLSGLELHDLLASLLSKNTALDGDYSYNDTSYFPNGGWQVYKYYGTDMTGSRVATTGSADRLFDVYATLGSDKARILAGSRIAEGNWTIEVSGLSAAGISGSVDVQTWAFAWNDYYGEVDGPTDNGISTVTVSDDTLTLTVEQTDTVTAWAFEFDV